MSVWLTKFVKMPNVAPLHDCWLARGKDRRDKDSTQPYGSFSFSPDWSQALRARNRRQRLYLGQSLIQSAVHAVPAVEACHFWCVQIIVPLFGCCIIAFGT